MTFTYSPSLATTKDQFRFRLGDTDSAVLPQLADEEISATIVAQPSTSEAMAICAEALAAKFMRIATTKQVASLKVGYEKRVEYLLDLAKLLRNGVESFGAAEIILTGITESELAESAADTDLVQPAFIRGQFDNPDATMNPLAVETAA